MRRPHDDGPVGAATREAWEEVGIPPGDVEVLGGLSPLTTRSQEMWIAPVVGRIRRPDRLRPEPGEVDGVYVDSRWVGTTPKRMSIDCWKSCPGC